MKSRSKKVSGEEIGNKLLNSVKEMKARKIERSKKIEPSKSNLKKKKH